MKKSICHLFVATFLCLSGVGRAEAQLGPILDWIYKLSGPGIMQAGLTGSFPVWTSTAVAESNRGQFLDFQVDPVNPVVARLRLSGMFGSAIDKSEAVAPPGGDIFLVTGQVILELDLAGGVVTTGVGVMAHVFFGDVDTFVKPAIIPARLLIRPFRKKSVLKGLTFGPSAYYYPKWSADDFEPLTVVVSETSGEWTWGLLLSYEFGL